MIRRLLQWSGAIVAIVLLLLILGSAWLLATESGARWLLGRASPYIPAALSIDEVHGNLLKGLEFRTVRWKDSSVNVSVAELAGDVLFRPLLDREIRITRLDLRNVEVSVNESPPREDDSAPFAVDLPIALMIDTASVANAHVVVAGKEFTIQKLRLVGQLAGPKLKIDRFDLESTEFNISLSGEAQLKGDFAATANAAWDLRLAELAPMSGVLRVNGNASSYKIQHDLDAPYEIATRGSVALTDAGVSFDLDNSWQRLRVEQTDAPAVELVDGALHVSGSAEAVEFDGVTTVQYGDLPAAEVQARGSYAAERINIDSLSVTNDWGQLLADGALLLAAEPSWAFNVALSGLDPSAADARMSGKLALTGKTSGRLVQQQPSLELVIERLAGNLNGFPVDGSGLLVYASDKLRFDKAVVRVGDNQVNFDGSYGRELSINAEASLSDLSQLGLGIAGLVNGKVQLATDLNTFEASGTVNGQALAWNGIAIDTFAADFDLPIAGDGTIAMQLVSAEQGSVAAEIQGRFVNEEWFGAVTSLTLSRDWMGEWTLSQSANFSLSRSRLKFEKFCLGTASIDGSVCGAVNYELSGPLQFEASINALPVAALPRYLPEGATVLGDIAADARGEFANGQLNAKVGLQVDGLGLIASFEGDDASAMFEKAMVSATVVDNRLVAEFDFKLEDVADHASGSLELDNLFDQHSALRGRGSLELRDLSMFSFFVPDLANPKGEVFGRVEADGKLSAPLLNGEIGLRDGSVDIRRAGISVTEIGLLLQQSSAGELSMQGSAKSGDGYLRINGKTSFGVEAGVRSEFQLNGENFSLIRLPDWQVTASPGIVAIFEERETRISGEISIPKASITVQTVPETTEKPSPDAIVHRGDTAVAQPRRLLFVDVSTKLGKAVSFNGFGLTTRLEGAVRISGDSSSPYKGLGRLVLREGRYQAYGQSLDIESGELIFNGPLSNPALNVRATRTASDKTVAGIHLSGTPAQLKSNVYSEPALGDAEALSYLLTGRPLNNASSAEGDMLNQAAFALGLTKAGNVASRIRNELGLDTFGIQGGAENRQLVAGKSFGDRLFIEYAYGVVDSLGTLLLRYQLSRRLTVESRSGSVRNVDVVYSVKKP